MTKQRALQVLAIFILVDIVLINQNWITAKVGDANSLIELTGTKTSALLSPLLILAILTVFIGFYINGRITAILLLIQSALLAMSTFTLLVAFNLPKQPLAKSGLIEKITGQTGTVEELGYQLKDVSVSPAFSIALFALALSTLWAIVTAVLAWRTKKNQRTVVKKTAAQATGKKKVKTSFDLWDSQR